MNVQDPIRRRKLSDEVQDRLLDMIDGLVPGDTLPSERELMQAFAVGRPAVREAMQNLERMGLVEIRHGDRARVAKPSFGRMVLQMTQTMRHMLSFSPASVAHLREARMTFEQEMVRVACQRRTASDVAHLRQIVAEQESLLGDTQRFTEVDGKFHREIAAISGNPIFAALSEALFLWLAQYYDDLVHDLGGEKITVAQHVVIVDAIEAGDSSRAFKAMDDHLNRVANGYAASAEERAAAKRPPIQITG